MKPLSQVIIEIIAAEKRREKQDAINVMVLSQDCRLTGAVSFTDYDPCFSELLTIEKMN